ncbi:YidB family protein [Herbaspirillum chlorophenolicum]|uniref:YidB family protein n=1 Tax=Herbaspirillum chlorophenolicum TaxID=211589 RepID=A0ABW8ESP1_9BURK
MTHSICYSADWVIVHSLHHVCDLSSLSTRLQLPVATHPKEKIMGLLDQLAGQVLSNLGTQSQDQTQSSALLSGVMSLINQSGGVQGLLNQLQQSGLGDQVASWLGTGQNQPVSGDQIASALGNDSLAQIAQQAGVEPEHAAAGLAQLLPQVIDHLSPNGQVTNNNELLEQGLALLKGKLFG